jgi:eukaryotic-like serine/threonine-protein kinase
MVSWPITERPTRERDSRLCYWHVRRYLIGGFVSTIFARLTSRSHRVQKSFGRNDVAQGGRYVLLSRVTSTLTTEVWVARAAGAGPAQGHVILTTISPELSTEPDVLRAALRDALAASTLEHAHLARVLDVGEMGESYYVASEYLRGSTLARIRAELIKIAKTPPVWFSLAVAACVCLGLEWAYESRDESGAPRRLMHDNVCPDCVHVTSSGVPKLANLGLGRLESYAVLRSPAAHVGRMAYLPPERLAAGPSLLEPDPTRDVYSLGVVVYEMLTGRAPFVGSDDASLAHAIREQPAARPSDVAGWLPKSLDDVVLPALAKNPAQRYAGPREFRAAIDAFLATIDVRHSQHELAAYLRHVNDHLGATKGVRGPSSTSNGPDASEPPDRRAGARGASGASGGEAGVSTPVQGPDDELDWDDPSSSVQVSSDTRRAGGARTSPSAQPARLDMDHAWDRITERFRVLKEADPDDEPPPSTQRSPPPAPPGPGAGAVPAPAPAPAPAPVPPPPTPGARPVHQWDAVVAKVKRSTSADAECASLAPTSARPLRALSPAEQAQQKFDEGMGLVRARNYQAAHDAWSAAAKLDPANRSYEVNLRKLEKLMK